MMFGSLPICPGCEQIARPIDCNGIVRWACGTHGCCVACFDDSANPNPQLGRFRREPSILEGRTIR